MLTNFHSKSHPFACPEGAYVGLSIVTQQYTVHMLLLLLLFLTFSTLCAPYIATVQRPPILLVVREAKVLDTERERKTEKSEENRFQAATGT